MSETSMPTPAFEEFGKIPRLSRDCVITEKIDGTNAQVVVPEDAALPILAGSRTRYITPEADNFGFAAWVRDHADMLRGLGPGRHFGEWWGSGIQRGYGLTGGEKRFSLFNVGRWTAAPVEVTEKRRLAPACCGVVPVLYAGPFSTDVAHGILRELVTLGSAAAPGFMQPEGIIVYHIAAGAMFKKTVEKDEEPKARARGVSVSAARP